MANDSSAARVESVGFDDLIPVARRLNTASDDLNAALKRIEERLNELGIGIARYVTVPETRDVVSDGQDHAPEEWAHRGFFRRFWMDSLDFSVALQSRLPGKEKLHMRFPDVRIGLSRVIDLVVFIKLIHQPASFWVHIYAA